MAEQYDHMQGTEMNVTDHPDHDLPTAGHNNSGMRVPNYQEEADQAKDEIGIQLKYHAGKEKQFSDIGLNPPGKGSLRNLDYNRAK